MPATRQRHHSRSEIHLERLDPANAALAGFAKDTMIDVDGGRVFVRFSHRGKSVRKQWMTRGQDFYPVWHRSWAHGGTATTALAQLVRWIQGRPVLPMRSWQHWMSETVLLGRERGPQILASLRNAGYPESAPCVLCGRDVASSSFDWWSLDGVSGPCCHYNDEAGCRQKAPADLKTVGTNSYMVKGE